ncbi:hypothetical protein IV203_027217 [Nitzschia inconspicua]|uniref:Uncharacterized protein n=1 Tax=Nitzschia inconspicua TaxID=303405 RepID=A0A9K3LYJ9_9STRA|nr:hypothetical protein IV203_027217 [Nitzschia inconspicua]
MVQASQSDNSQVLALMNTIGNWQLGLMYPFEQGSSFDDDVNDNNHDAKMTQTNVFRQLVLTSFANTSVANTWPNPLVFPTWTSSTRNYRDKDRTCGLKSHKI